MSENTDERYCGNCEFLGLHIAHFLPVGVHKLLDGWGICEVTGRVTHESTPCDDCEDYTESEGKED